jgi:hypothetical protein
LKEEAKHFKQKLRQINPMLRPIMEREVKKLLDAQIIIPLRYSEWVANHGTQHSRKLEKEND